MAAGRRVSSDAISTLRFCTSVRRLAILAVVVVLPEPCSPTIMMTTGAGALRSIGCVSEPSVAISSSCTILTTIWPGVTDLITSTPTARTFTCSVKARATSSATSASSSARRTSRSASSTSASDSAPRRVRRSRIEPSRSDRLSNIVVQTVLRSRAHRAVGRLPPVSRTGRRSKTSVSYECRRNLVTARITVNLWQATSPMPAELAGRAGLFDHDIDVNHKLAGLGLDRIGHIFLDEHVLGFELLVIEIIGDRLVGIVEVVIRAAMDEFQRRALRRLADKHIAMRRVLGGFGNRNGGFVFEAGIVGRGEDRHRQAARLDALLVEIGVDLLERSGDGVEGLVPAARPLDVNYRLCRQRRVLAEHISGLVALTLGAALGGSGRRGRRRGGGWRRLRQRLYRGHQQRQKHCQEGHNGHRGTAAKAQAERHRALLAHAIGARGRTVAQIHSSPAGL